MRSPATGVKLRPKPLLEEAVNTSNQSAGLEIALPGWLRVLVGPESILKDSSSLEDAVMVEAEELDVFFLG